MEIPTSGDIFLHKYDLDGNLIWSENFGEGSGSGFVAIVSGGYVYVGGYTNPTMEWGKSHGALLKYDLGGNLIWSRTWGREYYEEVDGLTIQQDTIYASVWSGPIAGDLDVALLRYDLNGNLLDNKVWEAGGRRNEPNGHIYSDSTGVYIAGGLYSGETALSDSDAYLAKFDLNGNYLWHRTWGGAKFDDAFNLVSDGSHLYVTGPTSSYGEGESDAFVLKYDMDGDLIWSKTWGGRDQERSRGISVDDEYVWVSATTKSYGEGGWDIALLKYKKDGTFLGYKTWGGTGDEEQLSLKVDSSHVYISGATDSYGAGGKDAFLMKVGK